MSSEGAPKPEIYNYDIGEYEDYKYATNIVVTGSGREFFISFVCARPYERPRCVGRNIVGIEHLREIIAVLSSQLKQYQDKKKMGPEEPGEGGSPFQR